ncbi:MAG: SPOR domain-containing protein, partial [Gemmatimonadota bacterium]|nr:SPOR domain-containing protein [Gemmatimonadota bacterium]
VPDAGVAAPAGGPQREVAAESAEGVRIVGSPDIHEDMEVFVTSSRPAPVVRTVPNYTRALLLLLLLVLVSAGYMGYVEIPWITSGVDMHDIFPEAFDEEAGSAADAASAGAPVTPAARVRYTSPVVPYTVTLGAIRDVDQVESFVADVRERVPEVLFYVVPVEVSGILYHRVMAGAEGDEAGAAALADRLAEALGREVDDMLVRSTPLAFRIGELPDVETARARAASIEAAGVPGYVLAVDVSDGRTLFRVYAGAFEKEPDATYLQNQLAQRGLGMAVLTQRTGRLPE